MTKLGIIGSGAIGAGIARLAVAAGHEVLIANSRGPESLVGLVDDLGDAARAGEVVEAARFGEIVSTLGFEPVDAGSLSDSWRFEPESGAYTPIYFADLDAFATDYLADPGAPLPADRLREILAASHRPDVAGRTF